MTAARAIFRSRKMALLALLGFSSGLPLYIPAQLLGARLADAKLDIKDIATYSLVGLAYTFKWLWAPLLDRFALPFLGRRRGWMAITQLGLALAIATLGALDPRADVVAFAAAAVAVAFLSASQDVVIDGYRTDVLEPEERAAGAAVYVLGYRAGMLLCGTLALGAADFIPWPIIYYGLGALMFAGFVGTLLAREPAGTAPPGSMVDAVVLPVKGLLSLPRAAVVLLFVALYKFGDHMILSVVIPFLKLEVGFTNATIAAFYKALGFAGVIIGGATAGALVARLGVRRMLLLFGVVQALTNLGYGGLALAGKSYVVFGVVVLADEVANSMGTAAFMAYLMSVCDRRVSATQYALLTSLSSVGQRVFGFLSGRIADAIGWPGFFAVTAALAVPSLLLLRWLRWDPSPGRTAA